ncbi:unnamed protein product, partial [Adineta ricciae]
MYPGTRRKKRTDSMKVTTGERESEAEEEEDDDDDGDHSHSKIKHQTRDPSKSTHSAAIASLFSLAMPTTTEHDRQLPNAAALQVAHILESSDLQEIARLDWVEQIQYFVTERSHLINQLEHIRTQFDKQYNSLKRRLDESETKNERLTAQHRSATKQLLLYKNLIEAPENSDSPTPKKDYQQLKQTIDSIVKENNHLYAELQEFITSDPVYDQVKLLETTNRHLQQELLQSSNQNAQLKKLINVDEIKHLKTLLAKTSDECEQLRLLNKKLVNEIEHRRGQTQTSSPKQVQIYLHPPSQRSPTSSPKLTDEQNSQLTIQNLRQLDLTTHLPLPSSSTLSTSANLTELHEHVQLLEQKLQQRDHELHTLQLEIEKGTSSIMSSIEDLCIASNSVSPVPHSPMIRAKSTSSQLKPTIEELQNEIDQLHDKLDEITRENQTLRNRTREFDTIYEENEYLYAEKSVRNEEMERARIRELVLEQEIRTLKEREKEFLVTSDTTPESSNITQLKLKIDWLHRTNNELELENVRVREQLDFLSEKCQDLKNELIHKDEHHKQILSVAEDQQQLPQELIRLEKMKINLEHQIEQDRQDYERTLQAMEEHNEKREQKYSTLYDTILKLQNDYRQKELDYVQQMDDIVKQRTELHTQLTTLQNEHKQIQQENKSLKDEIKSKDEINRDLKSALASSNNDSQSTYTQLRQANSNLTELQKKYDRDLADRNKQIETLHNQHKQMMTNYDEGLLKTHQTIIQLQHENKQYSNQIESYRSNLEKLQSELNEKKQFIEQVQSDLTERSALHVNINNQLAQENKARMTKISDLEHAIAQEQLQKMECQRTIQDLQMELLKSRAIAKESLEKSQELERRLH